MAIFFSRKMKIWVQAVRPFAFSASVIPVLLGTALAFLWQRHAIQWQFFPFALIGAVLLHAGTNAVSEYFDFKKGVDKKHTYGSSRVLVEGLAAPSEVMALGLTLFGAGALCALFIAAGRGMPVVALLLIALAGGFFYTGAPFGYKYLGLGDIFVFILMGPMMVAGTYYVLCGSVDPRVVQLSIPIALLVTAILSGNNLRDIGHDREAGVRTLENTIGFSAARAFNAALIAAAFLSIAFLIGAKVLSVWGTLVIACVPLAYRNLKVLLSAKEGHPGDVRMLDMMNAELHAAFGALLILAILAEGLFG